MRFDPGQALIGAAPSALSLGFDVGGTKIFGVANDSAGALQHTLREQTPVGADALVARLAEMAGRLSPQSPPASLGVGILLTTAILMVLVPALMAIYLRVNSRLNADAIVGPASMRTAA